MEFNMIVPVSDPTTRQSGDEEINGRLWRLTGPHNHDNMSELKFICVSYVWGRGTEGRGSFFDCKREISDQTRPALAAAMKAVEKLCVESGGEKVEAFWIDAICIPQLEVPARFKTLESMGFIYNAATTVIVVLVPSVFEVIYTASSKLNPDALSLPQMQLIEADPWISRLWTYQELINGHCTYFTASHPSQVSVIQSERLFNCIGYSLSNWKRTTGSSHLSARKAFPNLNTFEDTLGDMMVNKVFGMPALIILSNMAQRTFDLQFPKNRLLACLGALTTEVSWGPPSMTMGDLSEKFMGICEGKGDYSFVFTTDKRLDVSGKRWRPDPEQSVGEGPVHLVPIINWYSSTGDTQQGHTDTQGFWLDDLVPLHLAERVSATVENQIDIFLYGDKDLNLKKLGSGRMGVMHQDEIDQSQSYALHSFLVQVGFRGCAENITCVEGVFFSQESIKVRQTVELFAALSISYLFGYAGLARWKEGEVTRYCAGVFAGIISKEQAQSVYII